MGTSILVSEQLKLIDELKDYCIKNKGSWLSYLIKLTIGYYGYTDIDGEQMALEISDYVGVSYEECRIFYKQSYVKKMSSIVEVSKNMYNTISSKFYSQTKEVANDDHSLLVSEQIKEITSNDHSLLVSEQIKEITNDDHPLLISEQIKEHARSPLLKTKDKIENKINNIDDEYDIKQ